MSRHFWLLFHRWGGLILTVPLIIVGLTGSIIAFNKEMNHLLTPERYATPQPDVPKLDLATLAARATTSAPPGGVIQQIAISEESVRIVVMPPINMAAMLAKKEKMEKMMASGGFSMLFNMFSMQAELMKDMAFPPYTLYLDPWTGKELAREKQIVGSSWERGLMPFIHDLHDRLALPVLGNWVLGIIALLWTLDSFISYYLTFPVTRRKGNDATAPGKSWWARWKPAWKIKTGASTYRLNFDLHRANGLWLWPLLFVFAWSSVMFNLNSVYTFVTKSLFEYTVPVKSEANKLAQQRMAKQMEQMKAQNEPLPEVGEILVSARRLADEEGARLGIALGEITSYSNQMGIMGNGSLTSVSLLLNTPDCAGVDERRCRASLQFDARTGTLVEPLKLQNQMEQTENEPLGNFISRWLRKLHYGQTLGLWYQIVVCITGIVIAMLSITGIYIWWKKRRARKHSEAMKAEAELAADVTT